MNKLLKTIFFISILPTTCFADLKLVYWDSQNLITEVVVVEDSHTVQNSNISELVSVDQVVQPGWVRLSEAIYSPNGEPISNTIQSLAASFVKFPQVTHFKVNGAAHNVLFVDWSDGTNRISPPFTQPIKFGLPLPWGAIVMDVISYETVVVFVVNVQGENQPILKTWDEIKYAVNMFVTESNPELETEPTPVDYTAINITLLEFNLLFTAGERIAIRNASNPNSASYDPVVEDIIALMEVSGGIKLNFQNTIDGLNYLASVGILTPARAAEILSGSTVPAVLAQTRTAQ